MAMLVTCHNQMATNQNRGFSHQKLGFHQPKLGLHQKHLGIVMDCAIKNVRIQPAKRHANHPPAPLEMPSPSGGE